MNAGNKKKTIVGNRNTIEKFFKQVRKIIDFKLSLVPGITWTCLGNNNEFIWLHDTTFKLSKYFPGV